MRPTKAALFGGSGKIGRRMVRMLESKGIPVRALRHRRPLEGESEIVEGSVADTEAVSAVVEGCDLVVQLATTKEDPETFFDVSLKGTLNVLEACRRAGSVKQFLLVGGDAAFGIWFYPQPIPIDENHPYAAYPGYYAFSKVLEEVMSQQYAIQYGIPVTVLRSSWVFEGDDLLHHFSLLENVSPHEEGHGFGELTQEIRELVARGEERIPVLRDASGAPLRRHVVHIDDVLQALELMIGNPAAIGQAFNIAGPGPFGYDVAGRYLSKRTGVPTVDLHCPAYHSFEINITKARSVLGYAPENDFFRMADRALAHRKGAER